MIAQMQKRARGISRVGRRLFPNLRMTGLPAAWSQLLDDPITALDRRLASVTSDPTTASEENSNGATIDSPTPRTFRHPRHSPVSSQIADDPAIASVQRQASGVSRVGSRLFSDLGMTGLPPAWSQDLGDPITALDGPLASVTSVPAPDSEENSNGTVIDSPSRHTFRQPQQSLASSQIAYDPVITSVLIPDSEEHSSGTMIDSSARHTSRQLQQSLASSQIAYVPAIASVPTPDSEEHSNGTMIDGSPRQKFRQPQQSLASSRIAYDPAIASIQRQAPGISRVGSRLFPDLGVTGLPPACSRVLGDPIIVLDRLLASVTAQTPASETPAENTVPPNSSASGADAIPLSTDRHQSASPAALPPADISPAFSSSGVRIFPKSNFAGAGPSSLPKEQPDRTKLVPFSRLAEMLAPHGSTGESSVQPRTLEPPETQQTAPASHAVTVEAVLEQLGQRLQFEFLRTYGSSGE
jgi:hypothetical protein